MVKYIINWLAMFFVIKKSEELRLVRGAIAQGEGEKKQGACCRGKKKKTPNISLIRYARRREGM